MRASRARTRPLPPHALLASLGLHLLVLAALLLMPAIASREIPLEEAIAVEVVTNDQIELSPPKAGVSPDARRAVPATEAPPQAVPETPSPASAPSGQIHAKRLFSGSVLDDPRSREARQSLAQLGDAERIEQVCDIEAMSQIHAWNAGFEPDRVVAYSMAATKLSARTLQADGAVFRSKQRWYRLTFTCEMARDRKTVVGFTFEVGDAVPRREWAKFDLPAVH